MFGARTAGPHELGRLLGLPAWPAERQARLMLTLRSCDLMPFGENDVAPVGRLLAGAGTADVIDGFVALTAAQFGSAVVTSDGDDIRHLLKTLGVRLAVFAP